MLKIATLGFHDVTDIGTDSGFQRPMAFEYKHSRSMFQQCLEAVAASHLAPQLIRDIDFAASGEHLLLTFDDGGKSALYIGDELCRHGWRGHFFITTGLIGTRTFLARSEIVQLRRAGHLIGSHSHTHPDIFKAQSWDRMLWEWRTSCDVLAQLLGERCVLGSVPGGDISPTALRSADGAELHYLFTSEPSLRPATLGNCRILGRVCLKARTPVGRVHRFAAARGWGRALAVRRCSVVARTALYPLYTAYVRRQTRTLACTDDTP